MNKLFTFSSLLLSGILLGSIAGRINTNEVFKSKRGTLTNKTKNVKNFLKRGEEEDINQYFI